MHFVRVVVLCWHSINASSPKEDGGGVCCCNVMQVTVYKLYITLEVEE